MEKGHRKRIVSPNEARVVWSILSGGLESEEDRMRNSGIPRTTYRDAKHRLYAEGILVDRFIPNPSVVGIPWVSFLLTRPSAEEAGTITKRLSGTTGAVEVWSGPDVAFSVIFHRSENAFNAFKKSVESGEFGAEVSYVQVDTARAPDPISQVPVYFDFEGVWVHFGGFSGTRTYPRPLPAPPRGEPTGGKMPSSIASLLTRPFTRPSHLIGPASVPRSQKRNLREGKAEWRTFLGLQHLGTLKYKGATFQDLVFVAGELRETDGLARLLPDLIDLCQVRPLLMVGDSNGVLMIGLGTGLTATPVSTSKASPPVSVIEAIARHLRAIQVVREPLATLRMPIPHGYDRLA